MLNPLGPSAVWAVPDFVDGFAPKKTSYYHYMQKQLFHQVKEKESDLDFI